MHDDILLLRWERKQSINTVSLQLLMKDAYLYNVYEITSADMYSIMISRAEPICIFSTYFSFQQFLSIFCSKLISEH